MNDNEIKKVAVIGPECTGKSDLAVFLARHFNTAWVPEYARTYIENLSRPYEQHDLLTIARGQLMLEDTQLSQAKKVLICDTDLHVIKIWSEFKYGQCHPEILASIATRKYDLYLLTYVDVPWEHDPQREHPDKRQLLYEIYQKELIHKSVPYVEIKGEREMRRTTAIKAIEKLFLK